MEKTDTLLEAARDASTYFDRFDKSCLFHAAAHVNLDWLLSETPAQEQEGGLIQDFSPPDSASRYAVLFPKPQRDTVKQLRLQEIHQIVRELVEGIYVFNQIPSISLDSNYDSTSSVNIPSAYSDSLVGEALLAVDYYVKSLLHDCTIAQKDKRVRILDEWKKFPQGSLRDEFQANGMTRMQDDADLGKRVYDKKKPPRSRFPPRCVNPQLGAHHLTPRLTTGEKYEQQDSHICRETFLQYIEQVSLGLAIRQKKILQNGNIFLLNTATEAVTHVLAMQEVAESSIFTHLHKYLQKQRDFVTENLHKKGEVVWYMDLLGFISFMIHFLVTLKKQNGIIKVENLIRPRSKDVMRTERDVPPIFPSNYSRWAPHLSKSYCTGMHGGINFMKSKLNTEEFEISSQDLSAIHEMIMSDDSGNNMTSISSMEREIPTCEISGTTHYIIILEVEPYYPKTPKLPRWVHAMKNELKSQSSRLPPVNDGRIQDMLRKPLGQRKAVTLKTVNVSLQASIEKGLLPAVKALLKRVTQTRLSKPDEQGMTMLHHAATHARSDIISALMIAGSDVHTPVMPPDNPGCLTQAIHLAAKTGNVEAVYCLVHYGADLRAKDSNGWTPIHHAAFHNCQMIVRHLAGLSSHLVNLETGNKMCATPLLLAAQNGCFDSFTCLTKLGADLARMTGDGLNVVHLAAQGHHTSILKYLVELNDARADVWATLSEMLKSDGAEDAARNLDPLTRWKPEYTERLLEHKAVESLVSLLTRDESLQLFAVQVLANVSYHDGVKSTIVKGEAITYLVKLLSSTNDRIQVNASLVLCDLALISDCQKTIAAAGAIPLLVKLLASDVDDVQLFSCACIGILAYENPQNQSTIAQTDKALPILVSMLRSPLQCTQGGAANAIQAILKGNRANQLAALNEKIISPLVGLLRSKEVSVYTNAARTIEALAANCIECQQELFSDSVCITLLKRLLRMRDTKIKVCGGCALWAIAGILISNKRLIATHMGLELLVDMLGLHNEKLDYVCSEALGSLATELGTNQDRILQVGGVNPLVEVLTIPTTQHVQLSVIHTLSVLCMKPALVPNTAAQTAIGSSRGIIILSSIISAKEASEIFRVEAACTLAKLLLGHQENNKILAKHTNFSFLTIFQFFTSADAQVRLLAGYCLSIMAFDNPVKLQEMKNCGTLNISNFTPFLESTDQFYQVHSAFQIVVLSQLLVGVRPVNAAVKGLKLLVSLLSSDVEQTKVLSAEFIASLSRTGGGLPGALIMAATLEPLMMNLGYGNGPVIESACVALGYLTFNPMASRLIIGMFRDNPELFELFRQYFPLIVFSQKFLTEWNHITRPGIPTLR